jgi:hypothetical protein
MRTVYKVLTVAGAIALSSAHAEVCKQRIFFLPQSHDVQNIPNAALAESDRREVAESQLKIVNYLERFPQRAVFSEQATTDDLDVSQFEPEMLAQLKSMISNVFPRGYNLDPKSLNEVQIKKLVDNGGEVIQMLRGRLSKIHRVLEDKETDDRIFEPILQWYSSHPKGSPYPPEIARLIYGAREEEALRQIVKHFAANPHEREAVIIFGTNHSFSFYPDIFPPQCIEVPQEFRPEWTGRFRVGPEGFSPEVMRSGVLPKDAAK